MKSFFFILIYMISTFASAGELHSLASADQAEEVEALIKNGSNINERLTSGSPGFYHGFTPLMSASMNCSVNTVGYLTKNQAQVNVISKLGDTALDLVIKQISAAREVSVIANQELDKCLESALILRSYKALTAVQLKK